MDARLRNAYTFHKEHGGWIVGRRAEGALESARAELVLSDAVDLGVATVEWLDDEEPYDPGDVCTVEEARAKFESNEWTGQIAVSTYSHVMPLDEIERDQFAGVLSRG